MKKIILFFLTAFITSWGTNAQLTNGHVSYKIDVSSEDPEAAMAIAMFSNSSMDMYFDEHATRMNLNIGDGMMTMSTVVNTTSDKVLVLVGGMMGNNAAITTLEEVEENAEDTDRNLKVTLYDDKKTILGYKCKKAVSVDQDGNEITYWYTDKIVANTTGQDNFSSDIPGFPLEYSVTNAGTQMTFTAVVVEEDMEMEELFIIEIPEGYEEVSYEELTSGPGF